VSVPKEHLQEMAHGLQPKTALILASLRLETEIYTFQSLFVDDYCGSLFCIVLLCQL